MKAVRFNNLRIVEQSFDALRTEYIVASDTDRWSVTLIDNKWGVTHQGRAYRPVTLTPQGKIILTFVQKGLMV
jgi:hemin uptake protein HemP